MNKYIKKPKTWYAVYKGDEFICQGTKEECAEFMGVGKGVIECYATPSHRTRTLKEDKIIVIRVEEVEEEDEKDNSNTI